MQSTRQLNRVLNQNSWQRDTFKNLGIKEGRHMRKVSWGRYRINLQPDDIEKHKALLVEITRLAYEAMNGE